YQVLARRVAVLLARRESVLSPPPHYPVCSLSGAARDAPEGRRHAVPADRSSAGARAGGDRPPAPVAGGGVAAVRCAAAGRQRPLAGRRTCPAATGAARSD